jgi:outer membrane receptor protein involved in Fe transport
MTKLAVVPEKTWTAADGTVTTARVGAAHEDSNREGGDVSPMVELTHQFPHARLRRLGFSYAKTTQLPTYTALNSSVGAGLFRGNPNLGREKAHNFELGAAGMLGRWNAEGALFWRRDDALVDWTFRQGVTARTANPVNMDVTGIELVARRSWAACDLVVGYTGLTKDADYRGAAVDASFYALNYARHRLTAAATVRLGGGFEIRMDNVLRFQAANRLRTVGGDAALLTMASVSFCPPRWQSMEISVHVDNLWDRGFQDVPAVPAAPRQVSAGVAYVW